MDALTIGKIAQLAGVGVETIRFYEREGLITAPPRVLFTYRHYPVDTVARVHFIKRAKELGFSLKEIKELLALRLSPSVTCQEIRDRATVKIADIEDRIRALQRMRTALARLANECNGTGPASDCPILDFLAMEDASHENH